MKQTAYIYLLTLSCLLCACNRENRTNLPQPQVTGVADSLETVPPEEKPKAISAEQIEIKKDLLYDKYTLEGGDIHGVPVNEPRKALIEYSPSLGTTPRSHMCVRNATSHSKFIFDWAPVNETIIFVLE